MGMDIDIVLPWVDGNDPDWIRSRDHWAGIEGNEPTKDNSDERFRDWDTVKYVLRSIDLYLPWVRKVHFVTVGHLPEWLDRKAPKLNIVEHEDFIPEEYLPTFSSHTIELNMHRIPGLAEHFIYFNDDLLVMRSLREDYFFKNGIPCDYAILNALVSSHRYSVMDVELTNMEIINDHFNKNEMLKHNLSKWFNYHYGLRMFRTVLMLPWKVVSDFYSRHYATPYVKHTFEEVWKEEFDVLDQTCRHKFRSRRDVNQWLMRNWRLASGEFEPMSPKGNKYYTLREDNTAIINDLSKNHYNIICLNDAGGQKIGNFEKSRMQLSDFLETVFRERSSFEKT